MNTVDATRLSSVIDSTRLVLSEAPTPDDGTRLARYGNQSTPERDFIDEQATTSEFYKVGDKIGGSYEVLAIHHGAMGVVYGCFDHQTKLPRALKTVRARYAQDKKVLSMFESEATVWISLEKHPYIVRAYLVERFKNLPYVITEYVRGPEGMEGDLRGWLGHPRLTLQVAVSMALQIAQGMQHAVQRVPNLVHRDLKPANILVNGEGKAMVTDFGLVYAAQSGDGTPAYMSPEQWRLEAIDARSDIYAYGCILFEVFTAHRLFPAVTEHDWELAHTHTPPVSLSSIAREIPQAIDQFVLRCLEKDKQIRPQSWDEIVEFLADWHHRLTGKAVVFDFSSLALDANELITASYSLSNLHRYREMLLACERALVIDKNNAASWNNKGVALLSLDHFGDAIEAFDEALSIDQSWLKAARNKCRALLGLRRFDEMLVACNQALAIDQSAPEEWNNKSVALRGLKIFDRSLEASDQALSIDPNFFLALTGRGSALSGLNRFDEAIQAFNIALSIDPDFFDTLMEKGTALFNLKYYDEALQAFEKALSVDQSSQSAWYNKGVTLSRLHRNEEALIAYDQALRIDPKNLGAWFNTGNVLFRQERYEEALYAYDKALSIDPNCLIAWLDRGGALCNLRRYEEAILAYDRVLMIDSTHEPARNGKQFAVAALNARKK